MKQDGVLFALYKAIVDSGRSRAVRVPTEFWAQAFEELRPVDRFIFNDEPRTHFVFHGRRVVADSEAEGFVFEYEGAAKE